MKKGIWRFALIALGISFLYALGRLYFYFTAGFTEGNIASDFAFQPQWEVRPLPAEAEDEVVRALDQPYDYLGKGCQSYVFASRDGKYVIKFFKHQRYRLKPWLAHFPPLPAVVKYRREKLDAKWQKFNGFAKSWKIAFEELQRETGLLFVHLNATDSLLQPLVIYDKMGGRHTVALDGMTFCLQRRGRLLCEVIADCEANGAPAEARRLITQLLEMIVSEYARGLADHDHALMQNTGVVEGRPVHIDVGQFAFNEAVREPAFFHQELVNKTHKFNLWLRSHYPDLSDYLEGELRRIIGPSYRSMHPVASRHGKPDDAQTK